jgi:two-component system chemotaxis sensor kinase CheA
VLAKAKASGVIEATRTELSDDELVKTIARPGFSTADTVTGLSGRGVGIDAVITKVRALGGAVEIKSVEGAGTTITLRLPVTLAIVGAVLSKVGQETYALPMTHIHETVELSAAQVQMLRGKEVMVLRDEVLPVVHLRDLVQMPRVAGIAGQVIIVERAERRAGLVVDRLLGQQEIVVKPFDPVRGATALFSGATILSDGAPALILDVNTLL